MCPAPGRARRDGVVEAGQRRPAAGDLHGVDDHAGPPQRRQRRDVVAVGEPPVDEAVVEHGGTGALGVDHGQGGVDQGRVGLVEHDQDVGVGPVEGAARLGGVVEAEDGRGGTPAEDAPTGVETIGERREPEGPAALALGHRVHPEPALGDDPEGALTAHEELGQVGAGGRARATSPVWTMRPSASTTSRPRTMSSIFP